MLLDAYVSLMLIFCVRLHSSFSRYYIRPYILIHTCALSLMHASKPFDTYVCTVPDACEYTPF